MTTTQKLKALQERYQIWDFGALTEAELGRIRRQLVQDMEAHAERGKIPNLWYHFAVSRLLWTLTAEKDSSSEPAIAKATTQKENTP